MAVLTQLARESDVAKNSLQGTGGCGMCVWGGVERGLRNTDGHVRRSI